MKEYIFMHLYLHNGTQIDDTSHLSAFISESFCLFSDFVILVVEWNKSKWFQIDFIST